MAIEMPNVPTAALFAAAASIPAPDNPLLNSRGLQAVDPTSVAPDVTGGFTRGANPGEYILKTTDGADVLEVCWFMTPGGTGTTQFIVQLPALGNILPGTLGDGFTAQVIATDLDDNPVDVDFFAMCFRYATGQFPLGPLGP